MRGSRGRGAAQSQNGNGSASGPGRDGGKSPEKSADKATERGGEGAADRGDKPADALPDWADHRRRVPQSSAVMRALTPAEMDQAAQATTLTELDGIDLGIIAVLRENGRATNQEIADRLGVSPATVSARVRRFEEAKAMRVVAVTDFAAHGYSVLIAVGVQVYHRSAEDVARDLAAFPEIFSINLMTGLYDLEILVALKDFSEIDMFLNDHVAGVKGIRKLDPGIAVDVVKFQFDVAPL